MQLSKLYQSMIFRTFVCNFLMSKVVIHLISFLQYLNSIRATFFSLFTRQITSVLHNHIFCEDCYVHLKLWDMFTVQCCFINSNMNMIIITAYVQCQLINSNMNDIYYSLCAVLIAENILRVISQQVLLIISASYTSIG